MIINENKNIFKEIFEKCSEMPVWISVVLVFIVGLLSYTSILFDFGIYFLGFVVGLAALLFAISNPVYWLISVSLCGIVFFTTSDKGVSALDALIAAYLLGGLGFWFLYSIVVEKIKLTRNSADWIFLLFYFAAIFNGLIAVINGVELLNWLREYLLLCMTLYYFPIRHYFEDKKHLVMFLASIGIVYFFVDLFQFYSYYKISTQKLMYAYELGRTLRTNQSLMTAASISGIIFYFYSKKNIHKLLIFIFTATSIVALITSFSRTFWIILIIQALVVVFFLKFNKKIEFFFMLILISFATFGMGYLFMKDNVNLLFSVLENRFVSASDGKKDISVQGRLFEYKAAWKHIQTNPLGGNGLAKINRFYDPIVKTLTSFQINHNIYIHITYRLGFPLAICFFFFLAYNFVLGAWLMFKVKNTFYKSVLMAAVLSLFLMFVGGFTTPIMVFRDGLFINAYSAALIGIVYAHYKKERSAEIAKDQIGNI